MMRLLMFICTVALFSCSNMPERNFEFKYKLSLEANTSKDIKIWIPIPQSNEVQTISKLNISTDLIYEIKKETKNGNKYLYAELNEGLKKQQM